MLQVNFENKEGRLAQTYHFLLDLRACTCDLFKKGLWNLLCLLNLTNLLQMRTRKKYFSFFNLRAKRGGSLFEAGSEREENGGVASVQKWCA